MVEYFLLLSYHFITQVGKQKTPNESYLGNATGQNAQTMLWSLNIKVNMTIVNNVLFKSFIVGNYQLVK